MDAPSFYKLGCTALISAGVLNVSPALRVHLVTATGWENGFLRRIGETSITGHTYKKGSRSPEVRRQAQYFVIWTRCVAMRILYCTVSRVRISISPGECALRFR